MPIKLKPTLGAKPTNEEDRIKRLEDKLSQLMSANIVANKRIAKLEAEKTMRQPPDGDTKAFWVYLKLKGGGISKVTASQLRESLEYVFGDGVKIPPKDEDEEEEPDVFELARIVVQDAKDEEASEDEEIGDEEDEDKA